MTEPLEVACHGCGAEPGSPCVTAQGWRRGPHSQRMTAARGKFSSMPSGPTEAQQEHRERMTELRPAVLAYAEGRCQVGSLGCSIKATEVHHRQPTGAGGPDTPENAVAVCSNCHTASPAALHRNIDWAMRVGLLISRHAPAPTEPWVPPEADSA